MKLNIVKNKNNPLIKPEDIRPTRDDFGVDGVFNAGAVLYKEETILLLRVAESVVIRDKDSLAIPILQECEGKFELVIKHFDKTKLDGKIDFSDARSIWSGDGERRRIENLTSMSHLRIARSIDGEHFTIDDQPFIFPDGKYETWGIEDPRITCIDDTYYINYTAVSELGAATSLITTKDFITYERKGVIFPPENKDVTIFSEKINGLYYAYHRPVPNAIGSPNMWVSTSEDLIKWGSHQHLISVSEDFSWENGRIGGGAPSIKTDKGWLHIYHAADKNNRYCLGAFITPLNNPTKIIAKASEPILVPTEDYELEGFFGNVVFTCGVIAKGNQLKIYYGASDQVMALAETTLEEVYKALGI